jgi:hypothetical protein
MAKEPKNAKMLVGYIEGDQETVREALQQFGVAVGHVLNPQNKKTVIAIPLNGNTHSPAAAQGELQFYKVPEEETDDSDEELDVSDDSTKSKKGTKRVPKTPEVLKDFDPNEGEVSLTEFASQKDVSGIFKKYLVVATFFKRYRDTIEISTSHIYTCFGCMGWDAPNDMSSIFRQMKKLHDYFRNGSQPGQWEITIIGLNEVDKMTAKAAE